MKVSIIMTCSDRLHLLRNTLTSWTGLTYPDYDFTLIDNASKDKTGIHNLAMECGMEHFSFWRTDELTNVNVLWNKAGKESKSDYIVYAMADEIISTKDIIQKMLECPRDARCSVKNFFLSKDMTHALTYLEWRNNPIVIEGLPDFWNYAWDGVPNKDKMDAYNLSHITGWPKSQWECFGWFRNNKQGYRWLDQDVRMREAALGLTAYTVEGASCYHQFHGEYGSNAGMVNIPGFIYANERQARLLEEAKHE
jgi:glycosyltransferase involved in cell wall biosynthesis